MIKSTAIAWLAALALATGACAARPMEVKAAKTARYETTREHVWLAVIEALRKRYPRIRILDVNEQRLLTNWVMVERSVESVDHHMANANALFMRVTVAVSPTAPYRVALDVQAAQYRPGFTDLIPFPHGAADEPQWVEGRADRLYVGIYDELKGQVALAPAVQQAQATR